MSQFAKMKAPKDCGGITLGGVPIELDKAGFAKIPHAFVGEAQSHGFTVYEPTKADILAEAKLAAEAADGAVVVAEKALADAKTDEEKVAAKDAVAAAKAEAKAAAEAVKNASK